MDQFEAAVRRLIENVINEKPHKEILEEWDVDREQLWFPPKFKAANSAGKKLRELISRR